jgi:hypothetical protein
LGIKLEKPYFLVLRDTNPNAWIDAIEKDVSKGGTP